MFLFDNLKTFGLIIKELYFNQFSGNIKIKFDSNSHFLQIFSIMEKERERDRQTESQRETETESQRERETERQRQRQRQRQTERERKKDRVE